MRVLLAAAELAPYVRVGGLAEAAGGLAVALRAAGIELDVVVPDYSGAGPSGVELSDEVIEILDVPEWAGPASARTGTLAEFGKITLVAVPGIERPHAYGEPGTFGWHDNDKRFMAFSAAVVALATSRRADVLHANDWHTGAAIGLASPDLPSVFSIHNLAYQGQCDVGWLNVLGEHGTQRQFAYESMGSCSPLVGALRLANKIVAVSPTYAAEILTSDGGAGLDSILLERGNAVSGILNGIDVNAWNPATDPFLAKPFTLGSIRTGSSAGKDACRKALRSEVGLPELDGPIIGFVTRLVDQKGVDLVIDAAQFVESLGAQLVILGAGDAHLAQGIRLRSLQEPTRIAFREGFDLGLAHRIFAGCDLYAMPSRFEPCGLAQMQAMAYGAIPVVTSVGGLSDTVIDADADPDSGNGFVSDVVSASGFVDALHRAARAWNVKKRRASIIANGMSADWSWDDPAKKYIAMYKAVQKKSTSTSK
jgi:starch synthase